MVGVVISDLHIGSGELDDCDDELEGNLVDFLSWLSHREEPTMLIINGDWLDFVQAPPWTGKNLRSKSPNGQPLCSTEGQSLAKLEAILRSHGAVFTAIGDFICSATQNSVIVLPGNHDADFFWSAVRERLTAAICPQNTEARKRFRFYLDQVFRSETFPTVWIEHGHQHDFCNWFRVNDERRWSIDAPPILLDVDGTERLLECLGTRFLNKYLNRLDADYPFVDNVKPFSRFVTLFLASALKRDYGPLKAAAAAWGIMKFLATTLVTSPKDILDLPGERSGEIEDLWQRFFLGLTAEQRKSLREALRTRGFSSGKPLELCVGDARCRGQLLDTLADNLDLLDSYEVNSQQRLGLGGDSRTLDLANGFTIDETEILKKAARAILQQDGVDYVIMGHTHEVVGRRPGSQYINTGCWTRYYEFADRQGTRPWSVLKSHSFQTFPYELNYGLIVPTQQVPVRLETFRSRAHD